MSDSQRELDKMLWLERKLSGSMHAAAVTALSALPHNPGAAEGWLGKYLEYYGKHQELLVKINAYPRVDCD